MEFDGRVVLVTGGSRGIGRATAVLFAQAGASVAVQYRSDADAAQQVIASMPGGPHLAVQADLADAAQIRPLVDRVVGELGGIDVLVNNAGIYEPHPVLESTEEQFRESWRRTIDTNLIGPASLIFAVAPHMVSAGGGRIVNVSSRGAFRGEPGHTAYGASKAGLNSLSQSLAQELAPHGIYVTVVAPGFVDTDMAAPYLDGADGERIRAQSPLARAADPAEVARLIVFLASAGTEYATGTIVDVNGASYLRS